MNRCHCVAAVEAGEKLVESLGPCFAEIENEREALMGMCKTRREISVLSQVDMQWIWFPAGE